MMMMPPVRMILYYYQFLLSRLRTNKTAAMYVAKGPRKVSYIALQVTQINKKINKLKQGLLP